MKFSQRKGLTPFDKVLQEDSMDSDLRNSLWSLLTIYYWETYNKEKYEMGGYRVDYVRGSNLGRLFEALWINYFKKPIDNIPELFWEDHRPGGLKIIRNYFFEAEWYQVYDFIEFVADNGPKDKRNNFMEVCNKYLEKERSAYRFIEGKIVEISSEDEIEEIENAISRATPYYGVKKHLTSAITLMSDKNNPDYRNSIKESISAVESLCRSISEDEKATLGVALKALEKNGMLHPALKKAFESLYGYTSDSNGIRHSLMAESNLTSADARFMLISCSAFVNYVISSTSKA